MVRITGGRVYDPANGVEGVVKDICIADDGRVVADTNGSATRTIDAAGMVIFPGGVDVHTHVAGGALNFARGLVPENQRVARKFMHSPELRTGIGGMTPTTFATGYLYAGMGWTTVNEAAVPILSAKHTHEEMQDIPIVDKSTLLLMANNELMIDLLEAGEFERAKSLVGWMLWAAKTYGIKAVNPGGVAAWKWGKNASLLHEPIEGYKSITAAQIIAQLAQIVDELGLPHPMHLHQNNLGVPGNVTSTIETMKVLQGHRAHLAHLQFHAYGGTDWGSMRSEAPAIAAEFMKNKNLTCDVGAILFGNAVTITADGPWQHLLYELTGRKWGNLDVENETGCGIVPYVYSDHHLVNSVQWAVGLELLLLIDDPWRVYLTTDHPNGGGFWRYPEILRLLMDVEFRKGEVRKLPAEAQKRITLARYRSPVHVLRCGDPHVRRSGPRARLEAKGTPGHRCGRGHHHLFGEAERGGRPLRLSAVRAQGGEGGRGGGTGSRDQRGPRVHRASRLRPGDRGVHPPAVPEGLHDVVRKLPN